MDKKCVYCKRIKGKRVCPSLGGVICSRCCGENRGVNISCPASCRYFQEHEIYQRNKLGEDYRNKWILHNKHLLKREKLLDFMLFMEYVIYLYYHKRVRGNDTEILEALEYLRRKLSPIEVIEISGSPLGEHLWEEVLEYLRLNDLDRDEALEGIEASINFLKEYTEEGNKRKYLHGLLGHVKKHFNLPKEEGEKPSLIITPEEFFEVE